ncbi:MAG TPA: hypothetical protein PK912_14645, partial [Microthrixaceae bacterium]|nr:hypothetical protein [Microthrixaceae bacterium]
MTGRRWECRVYQAGPGVEHPLDLAMRDPEDRGSVRDVIEPLAVGAGPRVCPCTQRRASTGRALRGDQP